jgi:uncharacterized phosphosugar-binding protein
MGAEQYVVEIRKLVDKLENTQMDNIKRAAELITDTIVKGRLPFVFGAGHSHLLCYEVFARAGGLAQWQPILDHGQDFNSGARRQGGFERLPGLSAIIIRDYDVQPEDVMIVISNSGRNPAPVEMALEAKKRGAIIIALTSMAHSSSVSPANPAGKRLYEIADLVLDNGCPPGDALVKFEGLPPRVGPGSTVMGALIMNCIVTQVAENLLERGETPAVAMSGNLEGGKEYNAKVLGPARQKLGHIRHM